MKQENNENNQENQENQQDLQNGYGDLLSEKTMPQANICPIAAYGILRKGNEGDTVVLSGYTMYSCGSFPICVRDESDNKIVVQRMDPETEELNRRIDAMEINAGYMVDFVEIDGVTHKIYLYPSSEKEWLSKALEVVESGDWIKFNN